MSARKEPRSITLAEIERRFDVAGASYWFGGTWCPAVARKGDGYRIRVVKATTRSDYSRSTTYDYFEFDAEGVVTTAPRGYARDYKPGRVVDIAAAAVRYATPQPDAVRIGLS